MFQANMQKRSWYLMSATCTYRERVSLFEKKNALSRWNHEGQRFYTNGNNLSQHNKGKQTLLLKSHRSKLEVPVHFARQMLTTWMILFLTRFHWVFSSKFHSLNMRCLFDNREREKNACFFSYLCTAEGIFHIGFDFFFFEWCDQVWWT